MPRNASLLGSRQRQLPNTREPCRPQILPQILPHRAPCGLCCGLRAACSVTGRPGDNAGSLWQPHYLPCHAGAGPWLTAAHQPLHPPPSSLALGHIRSSSVTQQGACGYRRAAPITSATALVCLQFRFRLSRGTRANLTRYSTSGHDVHQHEGLLFRLYQRKGLPPGLPRAGLCYPGKGLHRHVTASIKEDDSVLQERRMDCPSSCQTGRWMLY